MSKLFHIEQDSVAELLSLNVKTVLFQAIQISIQFYLTHRYQVLPLRVRGDLVAMAIKECYIVIYSIMQHHNDTIIDRRTMIKTQ